MAGLAGLLPKSARGQEGEPVYQTFVFEKSDCPVLHINESKGLLKRVKFSFRAQTKVEGYEASGREIVGQRLSSASRPVVFEHPKNPRYLLMVSGLCAFPSRLRSGSRAAPSTGPGTADEDFSDQDFSDEDFSESQDDDGFASEFSSGPTGARPLRRAPPYQDSPTRPSAPAASAIASAPASPSAARRLLVGLGPVSWRGTFSLAGIDEAGTAFEAGAKSVATGLGLGVGVEFRASRWDYGAWLYGFAGRSQGQVDSEADPPPPASLEYSARNVSILGAALIPSVSFRPKAGHVGVGFGIPVYLSQAAWPLPSGIEIRGGNWGIGALINLRYERGRFLVAQKVGFLGRPDRIYWALELGYLVGGP